VTELDGELRRYLEPSAGSDLIGLVEDAKKLTEKMTGWRRPRKREIASLVRARKARPIAFKMTASSPTIRIDRSSSTAVQSD
jgi:hypothetical protein